MESSPANTAPARLEQHRQQRSGHWGHSQQSQQLEEERRQQHILEVGIFLCLFFSFCFLPVS